MAHNNETDVQSLNTSGTIMQIISRLIASGIILAITAFFTPGFEINNIWALVIAAVVLTVLDYLVSKYTGIQASPFGKGFVGLLCLL